jgi:hypothetical protein
MQKRGWIQIVEASISMLILFGLVLGLFQQNIEVPNIGAQVYQIQHQILTEASGDYCIRNDVMSNSTVLLNKFIASRLCTLPYSFTTKLCDPAETCLFPDTKPDTDIYSDNFVIAANLTEYKPVKIAFFVWQGSTECQSYSCSIISQSGGNESSRDECTPQYLCDGTSQRKWQYGDCSFSTLESAPLCSVVVNPASQGVCAGFTQTCASGAWQDCNYAAIPNYDTVERCTDNLDNNCNGIINEGCTGGGGGA